MLNLQALQAHHNDAQFSNPRVFPISGVPGITTDCFQYSSVAESVAEEFCYQAHYLWYTSYQMGLSNWTKGSMCGDSYMVISNAVFFFFFYCKGALSVTTYISWAEPYLPPVSVDMILSYLFVRAHDLFHV